MTDREAAQVLGALAGEPHPWLQAGVRVRWHGPGHSGVVGGVVRRREGGRIVFAWDDGIVGGVPDTLKVYFSYLRPG